jgi:tRNA pseudouridine38-40 synthase
MARYQIVLAYDGTEYHGFQRQANVQTIQGVVEKALRKLNWCGRSVLAAGRTDAGVHATGQVLAVDMDWKHSTDELRNALNAFLPIDIAVREVRVAPADFHPRHDAVTRKYKYKIICQEQRDPLRERFAWRLWLPPDFSLLQEASRNIIGEHDFAAFGTPPHEGGRTFLTISHAGWIQLDDTIIFEIASQAFLYQMVRRLVAIQVSIGQQKMDMQELILRMDLLSNELISGQRLFHIVAPPQGLILSEVHYDTQFAI